MKVQNKSLIRKEQRKEKSRNAARCRRKNESENYQALIKLLPIQNEIIVNIDQGTGLCLINKFMLLRSCLPECIRSGPLCIPKTDERLEENRQLIGGDILTACNGFFLISDNKYRTLFASHNVKQHLGVNETEIVGQDILSLVHEGDHDQIQDFFVFPKKKDSKINHQRLFCRMRTSFDACRSGKSKFKTATGRYKTFNCSFVQLEPTSIDSLRLYGIFLQSIPYPPAVDESFYFSSFVTHHSLDFKFIENSASKITGLIGYNIDELIGKSFFNFCHPIDMIRASQTLNNMTKWRQLEFGPYRFYCKHGGWISLVTQATRVNGQKNSSDVIVFVHYICKSEVSEDTDNIIESSEQVSFSSKVKSSTDFKRSNKEEIVLKKIFGKVETEAEKIRNKPQLTWQSVSKNQNKSQAEKASNHPTYFYDKVLGDNDPQLNNGVANSPSSREFPTNLTSNQTLLVTECNGPITNEYHQIVHNTSDTIYGNYEDSENLCYNAPSIGDPWMYDDSANVAVHEEVLFPDVQVSNSIISDHSHFSSPIPSEDDINERHSRKISFESGYNSLVSSPYHIPIESTPLKPFNYLVYNKFSNENIEAHSNRQLKRPASNHLITPSEFLVKMPKTQLQLRVLHTPAASLMPPIPTTAVVNTQIPQRCNQSYITENKVENPYKSTSSYKSCKSSNEDYFGCQVSPYQVETPLPEISLNDCEVNAPCTSGDLLTGPIDLLLSD